MIWLDILTIIISVIALIIAIYTFNENKKLTRKQHFESTFFNMMNQLEEIVNNLSIDKTKDYYKNEKIIIKGKEVFKYYFRESEVIILDTNSLFKEITDPFLGSNPEFNYLNIRVEQPFDEKVIIRANGVRNIIYELGIKGYENIYNIHFLDHYFRYIYRILKYVEESDFLDEKPEYIDERYKYTSNLRDKLTSYELVFVFYYGLSKFGKSNFKQLIEKYLFFKHLEEELLINSNIMLDIDTSINDYRKYRTEIKGDPDKYYKSAFEKDQSAFNNKN